LLDVQIRTTVATGNSVQRDQLALASGHARQQIGLLRFGTVEFGLVEDGIGPQAAGTTLAPFAPEEQLGTLL